MQKNYPVLYNQNDYPDQLGFAGVTIAQDGCFDTSLTMKANLYGHQVTPPQLNQLFDDQHIYVNPAGEAAPASNADLLPDNALARVYSDVQYIKTFDYEPIPTDLTNIMNLLNDPATTLTIRIKFANGNYHFVEAVNCDGHTLQIANPETGQIEDFAKNYGDPITANLHVLVYTGPIPPATQQPSPPSVLAMRFNQAITKSNNFDLVAKTLGISSDQAVTTSGGQEAVNQIQQLQENLKNAVDTIRKLSETPVAPVQPQVEATPTVTATPTEAVVPTPQTVTGPQIGGGKTAVSNTPTPSVPVGSKLSVRLPHKPFLEKIWDLLVFWLG